MKILIITLLLSAQAMAFGLSLGGGYDKTKFNCVQPEKSLQGCCSHHKGISQCGLGMVVVFKDYRLKCVDGWKSSCKAKK